MKKLLPIHLCLIVLFVALPRVAKAQAILNFPIPVGGKTVGFAIVNPNAAAADATCRLYSFNGSLLATVTRTIPARGQIALLDYELFPIVNNQAELGWVQIESVEGTQAFVVGGNFETDVDGITAPAPATQQVFPLIAGQMRVFGVNPGTSSINAQIQLYDVNGNEVRLPIGLFVQIPPKGMLAQDLDLTSGLGLLVSSAVYARITSMSGGPFVGAATIGGFLVSPGRDVAILTAIDSTTQTTELNFPHAVSGPLGPSTYTTSIGVINLAASSQNVTITFTRLSGEPLSVERSLGPGAAVRDTIQQLFSLPAGFHDGWIQIRGSAPLTGFVGYADTQAGGLAVSAPQAAGSAALLFNHIADLTPWWTGIALVNPGSTDATVEVFAMNADGSLIGGAADVASARFVLPARTKIARLLGEFIPATQTRPADGGFVLVRSTNNVSLFGAELFFLRSGVAFANVGVAALPASVNYTPPQP
jgi:hypothetical protein